MQVWENYGQSWALTIKNGALQSDICLINNCAPKVTKDITYLRTKNLGASGQVPSSDNGTRSLFPGGGRLLPAWARGLGRREEMSGA